VGPCQLFREVEFRECGFSTFKYLGKGMLRLLTLILMQIRLLTTFADVIAAAAAFAELPATRTAGISPLMTPPRPPAAGFHPIQQAALSNPVPAPISSCSLTIP